ncbi:MAG: hypothetical protein HYT76_07915 [Deltaproteobacteria bacterium]|nr:hypothetical protein [Deltaproteobacteria bacterium]
MKKRNGLLIVILSGFLLSACGNTAATRAATGTAVEGLEIASQMSLVEAQEGTTSGSLSVLASLIKRGITADQLTPYYTDPLDVWVFDESMESLSIINEILCSFDQTRYADMVNKGDYIALIDIEGCSKDTDHSSDQNDQSASAAESFETWVLNSSRVDNDSPQIVKAWIQQEATEFEPAMIIQAKMTITEGKSDTRPYGSFHMDFEMVDPLFPDPPIAQGYLETVDRDDDLIEFQFSMKGGDQFPVSENAHVVTTVDGTAGHALTSFEFSFGGHTEQGAFQVAFDEAHYFSSDSVLAERKCLDRQNFDNYVFRYGVYNADGSRVAVTNPGFGIKYNDFYGWAGYWGIWFPEEVELVNGLAVERSNNDESSGETYTVRVGPGKLVKHTKTEITLGDIKGAPMNYWDNTAGQTYRVTWNGTSLVKDAVQVCQPNAPCSWQEVTAQNLTANVGEWLNFWRDGLGGVFFEYPAVALSNSTKITFDKTQIMTGQESDFTNGSVKLFCYQDCLRSEITEAQINWQGARPYFDDSMSVTEAYQYSFDPSTMTLTYGGEVVRVKEGVTASGPNQWGIQSGPMLTSTSDLRNTWEVWGQSVYYTWETGPNDWNRFMGLLDKDNKAVAFDPPLRLNYKHTDGVLYGLEYAGFGELQGIPWTQVEGTDRWYPQLTIADGTEVTGENGTPYYVRALEMEQRMSEDDSSECSDLTFETLTTPAQDYTDPDVGAMPDVTADPAVIKGELTGS